MDKTLVLYSTDGCSLCEQGIDWLLNLPQLAGFALNVVDISRDDGLVERYGPVLPVLVVGGTEMFWPFEEESVDRALRELS